MHSETPSQKEKKEGNKVKKKERKTTKSRRRKEERCRKGRITDIALEELTLSSQADTSVFVCLFICFGQEYQFYFEYSSKKMKIHTPRVVKKLESLKMFCEC